LPLAPLGTWLHWFENLISRIIQGTLSIELRIRIKLKMNIILYQITGFLYNLYLIIIYYLDFWLDLNCVGWPLTWDTGRRPELCGLSGLIFDFNMGRWPELCELIGFWSLYWIEYWKSVDNETDQIMHDYTCRKLILSYSERESPHNLKGCEWKMALQSLTY
jgi:hypothetical protein